MLHAVPLQCPPYLTPRLCAGCYQPIDHTLPAARVAEVLQQSGARVLLVSPALAGVRGSLPLVEAVVVEPAYRQFADLSSRDLALRSGIDSAVFLLFTSGGYIHIHCNSIRGMLYVVD